MSILIQPDKHIALIMQPRSGSHVLRHFLSEALGYDNALELFNDLLSVYYVEINDNSTTYHNGGNIMPSDLTEQGLIMRSNDHLMMLNRLATKKQFAVFGVCINSYWKHNNTLTNSISLHPNIQSIRLERADVLYSILSVVMSKVTGIWHNTSRENNINAMSRKKIKPAVIDINYIEEELNEYLSVTDEIYKNFGELPIIYYEQFQNSLSSMKDLFDNIPRKLISIPFNKFVGNYKDLITNLDEVENLYEQFVNEHKDYFPQYFGKLPHIKIPLSQGRQPRDLSLINDKLYNIEFA